MESIYTLGKFVGWLSWIFAYKSIIDSTIKNNLAPYSFLFYSLCFSWELYYGIYATKKSKGSILSKIFNIIYIPFELRIGYCLIFYGNLETIEYQIWQRFLILILNISSLFYLYNNFANENQSHYEEKRHFTAWMIIILLPIIMNIENFTFCKEFVIYSAIGNLAFCSMILKDFKNKNSNQILKVLVTLHLLSTSFYTFKYMYL
jgi:hypothetical protein